MSGKLLSSTYITKSTFFTSRRDAYQLSSGKTVDPYYVVEIPDSVICMGITAEYKILMVEQYRHPIQQISLELPGGFMDMGELPQQSAEREIQEETGYVFSRFYDLGKTAANPGLINNYTHLYLALDGKKTTEQKLDEHEEIQILLHSMDNVKEILKAGGIIQSLHEVCLYRGFALLEKLEKG